jgi:hypothetical protein
MAPGLPEGHKAFGAARAKPPIAMRLRFAHLWLIFPCALLLLSALAYLHFPSFQQGPAWQAPFVMVFCLALLALPTALSYLAFAAAAPVPWVQMLALCCASTLDALTVGNSVHYLMKEANPYFSGAVFASLDVLYFVWVLWLGLLVAFVALLSALTSGRIREGA